MSNLSSETLFHFTGFESLRSILENEFIPHWCIEDFYFKTNDVYAKIAIPMVCFCDIPLGNIKEHMDDYGNCGIGMKKSWARKFRLNPVFYIDANSDLLNYMSLLLTEFEDTVVNRKAIDSDKMNLIFKYCKMLNGKISRNGIIRVKKFYNEREWRYVPIWHDTRDNKLVFDDELTPELKEKLNIGIENVRLSFEPNDINYIIVDSEKRRPEMIEMIDNIKWKYPISKREILKSKIISAYQIRNDF